MKIYSGIACGLVGQVVHCEIYSGSACGLLG